MKNLQNLKGAKALNRQEQQSINGGMPTAQQNGCNAYQQQYVSCSGAVEGRICYTNNCQCPGQCYSGLCVGTD